MNVHLQILDKMIFYIVILIACNQDEHGPFSILNSLFHY